MDQPTRLRPVPLSAHTNIPSSQSLRSPPLSPPVSYNQKNRQNRIDGQLQPKNRHTTPPPPEARREMEEFAVQCRAWYDLVSFTSMILHAWYVGISIKTIVLDSWFLRR
jgi:hypothetical protein